jgi:hypothetical protein
MCCCLPTLRRFFRHVAPSLIGERSTTSGDASNPPGRYALRTFGSSPMYPKGHKSKFDTLMRTQGTRLGDDDADHVHRLRPDGEFRNVTDIRGGVESQSTEDDVKADHESEEAILNSKTITVQFTYEPTQGRKASNKSHNNRTHREDEA